MPPRFRPEKRASQIVFDLTGGEKQFQTMTLATIPNRPPLIHSEQDRFGLRNDDIEGARYVPPAITPRNASLDITDIAGTVPKPMVNSARSPVDVMRVDDIEGTRPRIHRHLPHSHRDVNPVDPKYQLPASVVPPPEIPRFIRDSHYNDDVPGAHPLSHRSDKPARDIMRVDDIDGTRPVPQTRELRRGNNSLDVSDINNDGIHKTTRHINPLNPVYVYDGMEERPEQFGKVKPPPGGHQGLDRIIDVSDIEGTHPDASTKKYRSFRAPKSAPEDEELKPAPILMVPSMTKQTKELEVQQAVRQARGEKMRFFENRSLHTEGGTGDPIQGMLRKQRDVRMNRRHQTFE
jgi:hypothetical protein